MLLPIMIQEAIIWLVQNKDNQDLLKKYAKGEDVIAYLRKILKKEPIVYQEFSDISELPELVISETNRGYNEVENAKILYSALCSLNDSVATDIRLWAGLSHTVYYNFIRQNLSITNKNHSDKIYTPENNPIEKYFILTDSKRSLIVNNTISRLWWIGRSFYCDSKTDPFYYLNVAANDINMHVWRLLTVKLFQNRKILHAFIEFEKQHLENNNVKTLDRDLFSEQVKYLQRLSGAYAIDIVPEEFLIAKLKEHEKEFLDNKTIEEETVELAISLFNQHGGVIVPDDIPTLIEEIPTAKADSVFDWICEEIDKKNSKYFNILKKNNATFVSLQIKCTNEHSRQNVKHFHIDVANGLKGDTRNLFAVLEKLDKKTLTKNELMPIFPQIKRSLRFDIEKSFDKSMIELVDTGLFEKNGDKFIQKISIT